MSEYWVSQAKYFCKTCNVYMSNDRHCILLHNNGVKHKEKVEATSKAKRMNEVQLKRDQSELRKQLAEIDKAAKEAVALDRSSSQHELRFYQVSSVLWTRLVSNSVCPSSSCIQDCSQSQCE